MKVVGVPSDSGGCGLLRVAWPLEVAAQHDQTIEGALTPAWEVKVGRGEAGEVVAFKNLPDADLYIVQRVGTPGGLEVVRTLMRNGSAVILDLDDDLSRVHRNNVAWREWNGQNGDTHWRWAMQVAAEVDLVTVTTPRLAERFAPHGRFEVIPNCLPEAAVISEPVRVDERLRVGWAGIVATHPDDLRAAGGGVAAAMEGTDALLRIIGNGEQVEKQLGRAPDEVVEWVPPQRYPTELSALDVGIVPLQMNVFNRAKSGLKMLDYGAAGVAGVGSPTWDNRRVARTGVGVLAEKPDDWEREVKRLLTDDGWRSEVAARSQAAVVEHHLLQNNADRWIKAWERAWERAQSRRENSRSEPVPAS